MPNWCSTQYTIHGKPKDIDKIVDALKEARENALIENGFGNTWLGHVLEYLGMEEKDICKGSVRCRGSITYMDRMCDDELVIDTETAWAPMPEPIVRLCEKVAPDVEIVYQAIEPGCLIYITNDPCVTDTYLVDIWDHADDLPENLKKMDYDFLTKKLLRKELKEALNRGPGDKTRTGTLINLAISKWSDYMNIEKFDYVELCELY